MAGIDEGTSADAQAFHFSTDAFRPHERIDAWREIFGRTLLNIDIAPRSQEGFRASASVFCSPRLGVLRAETSPVGQSNTHSMITNDNVTFGWVLSSRWDASQLGRSADLGPGDAVLLSNGDVGGLTFPEACRYAAFSLPKSVVAPLVPDIGAAFARRVPAQNGSLRLLLRYLDLAQDDHVAADPGLQNAFTDHVTDLLVLALGATRDAAEQARSRGLPDARLRALKDDIRKYCHHQDLSIHTLAARHDVSARHVQRAFEEAGSTFTQYITEQRLAAAYKALRRRNASHLPISTIAFDCGFSDISHFNRVFRRHFGCTPSDARNAARSEDQ